MVAVGHGVDHGDIGMLRQFFKEADILVPDDKGVGPKTEIAADILQRLFFIQGFRREQDGLAAQQGDAFFKGNSCADACFGEKHDNTFSLQDICVFSLLDFIGDVKDIHNVRCCVVGKSYHVFHGGFLL